MIEELHLTKRFGDTLVAMRLLRGVLCVVLVGAGAAACEWRGVTQRHVVARLADDASELRDEAETPIAAIGEVSLHVLMPLRSSSLSPVVRELSMVENDGAATFEVRCPEALRGRRIVAEIRVLYEGPAGTTPAAPNDPPELDDVDCPATDTPVRLTLRDRTPGELLALLANGHERPQQEHQTEWLAVNTDSALELSYGVGGPRPDGAKTSTRFQIVGENRAGEARVLLDRVLNPAVHAGDRGWVETSIDLGPTARDLGSELRLRFRTRGEDPSGDPVGFPAWGDPTIVRRVPAGESRVNVVLVSLDTLRADRMGIYGLDHDTSPRLDRWARTGVVFERTIAPANWTLPSHATMLTGTYSCLHGIPTAMRRNGWGRASGMTGGLLPLSRILRDVGYRTAAFTEGGYVSAEVFHDGFEVFYADSAMGVGGPTGAVADTVARAEEWLGRIGTDPFFLFLHTYEVHAPYRPAEDYGALFPVSSRPWPSERPPSVEAEADAAAYAAELRQTDDVIGDFLDHLQSLDLVDRTVVILTSDHGEGFGEPGVGRGHGRSLLDGQVHVPLIWTGPGIQGHRRIAGVTSLADIAPTVLDLLDLPSPPWMQGVSLVDSLRGGKDGSVGRVVPSGALHGGHAFSGTDWKAIYRRDGDEVRSAKLFDLSVDPREASPRGGSSARRIAERHLSAHLESCEAQAALLPRTTGAESTAPPAVDVERHRKLEALGYLEPLDDTSTVESDVP